MLDYGVRAITTDKKSSMKLKELLIFCSWHQTRNTAPHLTVQSYSSVALAGLYTLSTGDGRLKAETHTCIGWPPAHLYFQNL